LCRVPRAPVEILPDLIERVLGEAGISAHDADAVAAAVPD
jgi:hypothetical protein